MNVMKVVSLAALILSMAPASLPGQNLDLSGTWLGETILPGSSEKVEITLVLQSSGDTYSGTISNSKALFTKAALEEVRLDNKLLKFKFTLTMGGRDSRLRVSLNSFMGGLIGGWVTEDGNYMFGPMDLDKKE